MPTSWSAATVRLRRWFTAGTLSAATLFAASGAALAESEYQCWPGTMIQRNSPGNPATTPYVISQPGCYWLAGARYMAGPGPAISITASHVYLDLRGQLLAHIAPPSLTEIITILGPVTDVHVTNGKLAGATGAAGYGVVVATTIPDAAFNISDLMIADDGVLGVPAVGILVDGLSGSPARVVIARNMIEVPQLQPGIGGLGMILRHISGSRIEDNVLVGRGPHSAGIEVHGAGNDVRGNTISGMNFGIFLGLGSRLNNIQHNTITGTTGIVVMDTCNTIDWNVSMGTATGIDFWLGSSANVYSFNRTNCTFIGSVGINDPGGSNVDGGNNF